MIEVRRRLSSLIGPLLLVGCVRVPPPAPAAPPIEPPAEYAAVAERTETVVPAPGPWWEVFGAPDLDAAVAAALAHNPEIDRVAARLEEAAAQARIAGADRWPQVSAGLDASRRGQNFVGFPIPGAGDRVLSTTTTTVGASLNVSWELDLWGRVEAARQAAGASYRATEADAAAAYLSLSGQTAKAWSASREAEAQAALADAVVANREEALAAVERRYRSGLAPAATLRQARADLAAARASASGRRQAIGAARRALQALMGDYPDGRGGPNVATGGSVLPAPPPLPAAGAPADLLLRRPDLTALTHRLEAAGYRVHAARAARLPALRLSGSAGRSAGATADLADDDFSVWSLAGGLLQPILQGGRLAAGEDAAEAGFREARAVWAGAFLRAATEVENALAADAELSDRIAALEEAVTEAEAAASLAARRHRLGVGDYPSRLEAERSLALARSELAAARRARFDNRIDLHLALGGGFRADARSAAALETEEDPS